MMTFHYNQGYYYETTARPEHLHSGNTLSLGDYSIEAGSLLIVSNPAGVITKVELFNASGRSIIRPVMSSERQFSINPGAAKGVVVARISGNGGVFQSAITFK